MNDLSMPPAHLRDTLSRLAYFSGWETGLLARLAAGASHLSVAKDMPILGRGDVADYLYVLVSGQVRLYIPLSNGMERIVSLVKPGEGFGEIGLLLNTALPYGVAACRDSHLLAINAHAYRNELAAAPHMMERTLNLVARQFQDILMDMDICAQPSSLQRVVRFLLSCQPMGETGPGYEVILPGRKRDVAARLGLTQETFSRMLSFLVQQGVIDMQGSAIQISDSARLREMDAAIGAKELHRD